MDNKELIALAAIIITNAISLLEWRWEINQKKQAMNTALAARTATEATVSKGRGRDWLGLVGPFTCAFILVWMGYDSSPATKGSTALTFVAGFGLGSYALIRVGLSLYTIHIDAQTRTIERVHQIAEKIRQSSDA